MIAPFLGFNGASYMSFTWVMDHFLYIAMIGLIGLTIAALERTTPFRAAPCPLSPEWRLSRPGGPRPVTPTRACSRMNMCCGAIPSSIIRRLGRPTTISAHVTSRWAKLHEARAQYEAALRLHPDYADALNNLGNVLIATGHAPEAIAPFEHALVLNPNDASVHYNLGLALLQSGRTAEATRHYEEAVRLRPTLAEAHYSLGNIHIQAGQLPEAIAEYEAAVSINRDYADAHANLGNALLQSGRTSLNAILALPTGPENSIPNDIDVRNTAWARFSPNSANWPPPGSSSKPC